jgi:DHA2 family multidrug resistance protein-like MFS transporter
MSHRSDAAGALTASPSTAPARAGIVLASLIAVAAVANLNLSVANVALPSIGRAFDSSQTTLDLIAVGYSLGLAASVLYLGAVGDRYGRKLMLLLGMILSVPACVLAAYAPSDAVLFVARLIGGLSAGLAYPTTLALIAALWSGPRRTACIALWSAIGGGIAALGPLVAGGLLEHFWWGSVFLVTLPLAVVALLMAWRFVPSHVNETTERVDNLGGVLSVVLVGTLILAINFAPVPSKTTLAITLGALTVVALILFVLRQRRAANPLYDLHVAGRRIFWVAALAGVIVFGSLMGAAFVSQQYLQNVLGYSTFHAGAAFLPTVILMVLVAPRSAKLVEQRGARFTLLTGYVSLVLAFGSMLLLWREDTPYWKVGLAYAFIGIGVGFAGTPASHSLTGSVPVTRAGMASGTADLQRDLGGAIMQSIFGALLTAGYAKAFSAKIAASPNSANASSAVQNELTKSFSSATDLAQQYPQYSTQIVAAAKSSFLSGDKWAYTAGIIAILIGFVLVFFMFPKKEEEERLLAEYHAQDTGRSAVPSGAASGVKVASGQVLDHGVDAVAADPDRGVPRGAESEQERHVQPENDSDPVDEQRPTDA